MNVRVLIEAVRQGLVDLLARVEEKLFDERRAVHRHANDALVGFIRIEALFDFDLVPNLIVIETSLHTNESTAVRYQRGYLVQKGSQLVSEVHINIGAQMNDPLSVSRPCS